MEIKTKCSDLQISEIRIVLTTEHRQHVQCWMWENITFSETHNFWIWSHVWKKSWEGHVCGISSSLTVNVVGTEETSCSTGHSPNVFSWPKVWTECCSQGGRSFSSWVQRTPCPWFPTRISNFASVHFEQAFPGEDEGLSGSCSLLASSLHVRGLTRVCARHGVHSQWSPTQNHACLHCCSTWGCWSKLD